MGSSLLDAKDAITILGAGKVVTLEQARLVFKQGACDASPFLRYTEKTLLERAASNQSDKRDWRLVHPFALSFCEQREIIGVDPNHRPCFYNNHWWLADSEATWATSKPEAGYVLIDMSGRFRDTDWDRQSICIEELGGQFERADERVFSQALASILRVHGERLYSSGTSHRGRIKTSDGHRLCVQDFGGIHVNAARPSFHSAYTIVCVSQKWDF